MAVDFTEAWQIAERTVFDRIVERTGATEGASAFCSDLLPPGILNAFSFATGGGSARHTWAGGGMWCSLRVGGALTGRYHTRAQAQLLAGQIMDLMRETSNFNEVRNIQWFRMAEGGMPVVAVDTFQVARSNAPPKLCHMLTMGFELVYNTSHVYGED